MPHRERSRSREPPDSSHWRPHSDTAAAGPLPQQPLEECHILGVRLYTLSSGATRRHEARRLQDCQLLTVLAAIIVAELLFGNAAVAERRVRVESAEPVTIRHL